MPESEVDVMPVIERGFYDCACGHTVELDDDGWHNACVTHDTPATDRCPGCGSTLPHDDLLRVPDA